MNRSTQYLIGVLVVLAVITYFLLPSSGERETSYTVPAASVMIDSAAVVKIEIKQPTGTAMLENIGGRWEVTAPIHAPADPVSVAQLLNGFSKFKVGSLISSNPEKQRIFQVDSAGTRVSFSDRSGKITTLIIGKMGPSFSEVYFRLPESKDVYLGEGIDTWKINKSVNDWRDRTIVRASTEMINEMTITAGVKVYSFTHDSAGWKLGEKPVETNDLNPLLNSLSNLRAEDFIDTVTEIRAKPITLSLRGFENVSINFYPILPDSLKYYARSTKSPQLYVVGKWVVQQLLKPTEKSAGFMKPSLPVAQTPEDEISAEPIKEEPPVVVPRKETPKISEPVKKSEKESAKPASPVTKSGQKDKNTRPESEPAKTAPRLIREPAVQPRQPNIDEQNKSIPADEEGELVVHTVAKNETMTTIARKYGVTPEMIIKWNLLKSIAVKPGQELYIYKK